MNLIIKPTVACNFKCSFCSSTTIADNGVLLDLDYIKRFITRYPNTNTIIVNGGDPLVVVPEYYWKLIEILDDLNSHASISFTSNLYPFYLKPEKWVDLFKHERVGVCTSFQYSGRLKHDYSLYTEEEFWQVSNLFLDRVGYRPDFISVLTDESKEDWIDLVLLAKKMGVVCKLNYANASGGVVEKQGHYMGNEDSHFIIGDAYDIYLQIYETGLTEWEWNTQQMVRSLQGVHTTCPLNTECDKGIRVLQPNGDYYSCGAFGDDKVYEIDFEKEMRGEMLLPLSNSLHLRTMTDDCYTCYNYSLCNGCRKGIEDTHKLGNVGYHCQKMKSLTERFRGVAEGVVENRGVGISKKRERVFRIIPE